MCPFMQEPFGLDSWSMDNAQALLPFVEIQFFTIRMGKEELNSCPLSNVGF